MACLPSLVLGWAFPAGCPAAAHLGGALHVAQGIRRLLLRIAQVLALVLCKGSAVCRRGQSSVWFDAQEAGSLHTAPSGKRALLGKRCRLTQSRAGPSGSSTVLPADGPPLDPPRWTATSSALIKKRAAFQLTSVTSRAVSCTSAAAPVTVSLTF